MQCGASCLKTCSIMLFCWALSLPLQCLAQAAVPASEFQNWASFFGRYQYMAEVCTGEKQVSIQQDVFEHIDRLYPDTALAFQAMYLAGYKMAINGRNAIRKCGQQQYQQSRNLFEKRMAQLNASGASDSNAVARVPDSAPLSSGEPSSCVASPPGPYRREPPNLEAILGGSGYWKSPGGGAAYGFTSVKIEFDSSGQLHGWALVYAQSDRFKLYAMSQAAIAFADSQGRHVSNPYGFMGMSGYEMVLASSTANFEDSRERQLLFRYPASCDITFALLKYRFCGMTENLDRRNTGSSDPACFGGPDRGRRLPQNLYVNDFEETLAAIRDANLEVGKPVDIGLWKVVKLR